MTKLGRSINKLELYLFQVLPRHIHHQALQVAKQNNGPSSIRLSIQIFKENRSIAGMHVLAIIEGSPYLGEILPLTFLRVMTLFLGPITQPLIIKKSFSTTP
jgi:hypothetical protein